MVMPALLLLVAAVKPTKRQMLGLVLVMCWRGWRWTATSPTRSQAATSRSSRLVCGKAAHHGLCGQQWLAAFEAQFATFLLIMAAFERRRLSQAGYYAVAGFSALCLMYSLSRAATRPSSLGVSSWLCSSSASLLVLMAPVPAHVDDDRSHRGDERVSNDRTKRRRPRSTPPRPV